MIITTLMAKNVYEQDSHYQSGTKKWSGIRIHVAMALMHVWSGWGSDAAI